MKILLLNGSPKGEASDTLMLSKVFLDGIVPVGTFCPTQHRISANVVMT